ncbi:MAG: FAD:protein FMN transferase [Thermus sp.]|uniref:FAD:protein FMN transferase n=1 Tax=Thermus sp. TaxID=275 RepID=UPI0025EF4FEC|nr:FAD:protein FMN transferase [Thermus sp.]MCS6869076.1 FAD:protein FMN transferase [Thermus sp.]MCS7217800.1 FAD:protein FMN transferase [Thermus sp.]MDW8016618.1 FAD:protein FMN transferase [Thermus sp.]MDW8356517.1 FAD:protein FMN transferase [Thermus sp.]
MGRYGARWEGVLGSFLEVQLLAPPWRKGMAFRSVVAEIGRLEGLFSRYRESELTRLVRQGGGRPSPELREVLAWALRLQEATGGAFHPAPRHGGEALRFHGEEVEVLAPLDLDGLAKGYMADRAAEAALRAGARAALVNLGGDLARKGPGWAAVGVEAPRGPDNAPPALILKLGEGGVATSGVRHRGAHLLDPRTGKPAPGLQATVQAPSALLADGLAKALFVLGREAGAVLKGFGAQGYLFGPQGPVPCPEGGKDA